MKRTLLVLCSALVLSAPAFAHSQASEASASSVFSAASVVAVSVIAVVSAPAMSVISVMEHSAKQNQFLVQVKDDKGRVVDVPVNKEAARRAGLKPGDTLTSTPRKSGVLLSKDGKPVTFVVPAKNAELTLNNELQR